MALSCEAKGNLLIFFAIYSGILTGLILGVILIKCVLKKRRGKKATPAGGGGVANRGFQDTHTVSPSRLRDDLEAQRRYRDKATPILAQRVTVEPRDARPDAVDHPGVRRISHGPERVRLGGSIGSFYSVDETSGTGLKHGVEYLELNDIPQDEFASVKSRSSSISSHASTLYDDVQSSGSKSKTSLRDRGPSSASSAANFYDAREIEVADGAVLHHAAPASASIPVSLPVEEDEEKIYQEIPDIIARKSSQSSSATSRNETYDDVQNVVRRSRKKAPPPAPPISAKKPPATPPPAYDDQEENYDDVANLRQPDKKSSASSSASSELQRRREYIEQDRENARKSFQEAPEKYRKESSYLTLDNEPNVKADIVHILDNFGRDDDGAKSASISSSSSSTSEDEIDNDQYDDAIAVNHLPSDVPEARPPQPPIRFVSRKSSFSSASLDLGDDSAIVEDSNEVVSFGANGHAINIDDDDGSSSSTSGSFKVLDHEDHMKLTGMMAAADEPVTNNTAVIKEESSASPDSSTSDEDEDHADGARPSNPMIKDAVFADVQPLHSSAMVGQVEAARLQEVRPPLQPQYAQDEVIDGEGEVDSDGGEFQIKQCVPAQVVTSSSGSEDSTSSSSSSSEEEQEAVVRSKANPGIPLNIHAQLPQPSTRRSPRPNMSERNAKSLSLGSNPGAASSSTTSGSSRKLTRTSSSSSSSDDIEIDNGVIVTSPAIRGYSSLPRKSSNDPLSDSFLRKLNRDYEPVYNRLRKVNSTTQTEVRSKSTETW